MLPACIVGCCESGFSRVTGIGRDPGDGGCPPAADSYPDPLALGACMCSAQSDVRLTSFATAGGRHNRERVSRPRAPAR